MYEVMSSDLTVKSDELVAALKASAEPTRLRILLLLATGEFNVKDLQLILGQSQPRISRHLKLLTEAGLVERFREGSWAYFHLSDRTPGGRLALGLLSAIDTQDAVARRDRDRADSLKREREAIAQSYFETHASDWDRIRALHVAEDDVETALQRALGPGPFRQLVDLGTGTGRILELLADRYDRAIGIDANQSMLAYARSKLATSKLKKAQLRHGDIYALALPDAMADAVIMHQVLHYLSDPQLAIREAARILVPGGKLVVVDFAPHDLEFLRDSQAHERLGFADNQIAQWMTDAGLQAKGIQHLPPDGEMDDKLIVTLWQAERPKISAGAERVAEVKSLEETG